MHWKMPLDGEVKFLVGSFRPEIRVKSSSCSSLNTHVDAEFDSSE